MIIGIGTDVVEIARIETAVQRHQGRFEAKCFTPYEQAKGKTKGEANRAAYFAKRFAAKEAFAKALGRAFVGDFSLKDIGVEEDEHGRPYIVLGQDAKHVLDTIIPAKHKARVHLTLSDEREFAVAFVVIEAVS